MHSYNMCGGLCLNCNKRLCCGSKMSIATSSLNTDAYFRDMTNDGDATISEDGQLTLVKVSKQHEGEWKCQATNSGGTTEQTMKVLVNTSIVDNKNVYYINCHAFG